MGAAANAFLKIFVRTSLGCAAAAACAGAAAPANMMGLRDGETLTYSVRFGLIPSVGRIKIAAETIGYGREDVLRVTTTTWTWGPVRAIFPFDGRGESVYRLPTGVLLSASEWSTYRNKVVRNSVVFDYGGSKAVYTDEIHPEKSRTIPMPGGVPSDLILALIQTRYWNLRIGEQRDALIVFEDQFYPLTIRAEEVDYVITAVGVFKTLVLVPRMEKTPQLGMFRRGSTVRVWIETDDDRHLPVRFEVGFRFGSGTATLLDYSPPK
ncbi:MAG: DUF3108 domain-containing protein [Opitutaceae bacterium]|jgi:hypothetical protein